MVDAYYALGAAEIERHNYNMNEIGKQIQENESQQLLTSEKVCGEVYARLKTGDKTFIDPFQKFVTDLFSPVTGYMIRFPSSMNRCLLVRTSLYSKYIPIIFAVTFPSGEIPTTSASSARVMLGLQAMASKIISWVVFRVVSWVVSVSAITPKTNSTKGVQPVIHYAPDAERVPFLVNDLFEWLRTTDEHPLIASCVFHYEFEFIHPFADGNGRTGRLWQTLIFTRSPTLRGVQTPPV